MSNSSASTEARARRAEAAVERLLRSLDARAAGLWRVDGAWLRQVAFVGCPELSDEVGRDFAAATRAVGLSETSLGIVAAVVEGRPVISRVEALPAETGSGRWLRAFGAERSVAIPLREARGARRAVLSVAVGGDASDEEIADRVRAAGAEMWDLL